MRDLTDIVLVMDKSGSMEIIKEESRTGVNAFIRDQQKVPGEANLSIVLFSSGPEYIKTLAWRQPIQKISLLNQEDYIPDGMTCLHDAIGETVDRLGKDLDRSREEDKPNKILFVVQTDGLENSSSKYTGVRVRDMIKHQEDVYSWKFIYLGQHLGATTVADSLGVPTIHVMQSAATPLATAAMYSSLSNTASAYRMTGNVEVAQNVGQEEMV